MPADEHLIEFLARPDVVGTFPAPYPAGRAVPQWLKDMPPGADDAVRTVKRCPPFLEAMMAGYIIPVAVDITLTRRGNELNVDMTPMDFPLLGTQHPDEFPGAPFNNTPVLKLISPWIIKTPPGYSTLFIQPLNHFHVNIMPLAGLVETDTFYRPVAFPTLVLMPPESQLILKAGTPLVQAIPVPREAWRGRSGAWDHALMTQVENELNANHHLYKEKHWQKKSYL